MKRYKVGYTTGVFDLFHIGHLNILRRAKEECEHLVVGVSTDELVMAYKQKKPVIPYDERKAIVEGIKYVDHAVAQNNRDKYGAWEHLLFDALFVGDDWKGNAFFNDMEEKFAEVGVDIVYFPYTKGVSSTTVREKAML